MPPSTREMTMADLLLAMLRRQGDPGIRVQTFHEGNFLDSLAVAVPFTPVVTFTLPVNMQGQLEGFTHGCEILSDFDQVVWQIRIDNGPVQNYDFIQGAMSTFVFPKQLAAPIPIRAGGTIDVAARATTTTTLGKIAAMIMGTFWPSQGGERQRDFAGHVTGQL